MNQFVLIHCTAGSRDNAESIASALVERRLAACVQIVPVESVFVWNGAVRRESELLLHVKTTQRRAKDVEACIKELHEYDVPEIATVEMIGGSREYLDWIEESVR